MSKADEGRREEDIAAEDRRCPGPGVGRAGASGGLPPLSPEELADWLVPADPRIAPDGRSVAFVAAPAGRRGPHPEREVWLPRVGEGARRLTGAGADDADPRWSADERQSS